MKYSQSDIDKVRKAADIRNFIPNLKGSGTTMYTTCPKCGKTGKGKGLQVTHKSNLDIAKCFSCGYSINGSINAVMEFKGFDFPTAVKYVADSCNIYIEPEKEIEIDIQKKNKSIRKTFCDSQLESSGLSEKDISAKVIVNEKGDKAILSPFRRGGMDKFFNINAVDDELLIFYYDLWGNPVKYATRGAAGKLKDYVRVRWSNPALHLDSDGREIKYQTPKGAPTKFYFPQKIRDLFLSDTHIETLVVQEGEKKAEKACKHGIPSIGIQGIYNIGNAETGLIQDLQYLVQKCTIKNIIMLMDSDWNNLHKNIINGDHIDQRPNQFAKAIIKFRQYVQTLHSVGASVDIFFGHINENKNNDKGIDDLLCNTLKGKEDTLRKEFENVLFTHDGVGKFVNIHKISTLTDFQIKDFWSLNDKEKFFKIHEDQLAELANFKFGKITYRNENGTYIQANKYAGDKDFWLVSTNDKGKKVVDFDYIEALRFISDNGYYKIHTNDLEVDQYKFVHIEDGIVSLSGPTEIRDFIYYYALQECKDRDVHMMLASRLGSLLGADKLERIPKIEDDFDNFNPNTQHVYFKNGQAQISANGIEFGSVLGRVWKDKVIRRKFKRTPIITDIIAKGEDDFEIKTSAEAVNCDFYNFICHTSYFWDKNKELTDEQYKEYNQHIVNKITSIGFLLCDYKFQTELKAIVSMDGQMGEIAQSNGRTGKSLIGLAIKMMLDQTYIDGKNLTNNDEYIYSEVTLRTRNIFIDDVRVNFDFERFFAAITGDLNVNPKTKARFVIPNETSPKFYITTNHALNAANRSALERINFIAFSDWYNDFYRPIDDFGHQFFADWDSEQWNLFDNFMIECIMFYLKSMANKWYRAGQGAIPPPMKDITMRTLKQQMGEAFYQWAETYFDESSSNLNSRISRKIMYDAYHSQFPEAKFGVTPSNFRTKVVTYCQFKGYHFNVSKPNKEGYSFSDWLPEHQNETFIGGADKSGGIEYFAVFSTEFAKKEPF